MSTSQDKTAQQILASAVEVRELPAQESDPGRRQGCLQGTLSDEDKELTESQEEQNCCILYQGILGHLPFSSWGQWLVSYWLGKVRSNKISQGQKVAIGIQEHLCIWGAGRQEWDENLQAMP